MLITNTVQQHSLSLLNRGAHVILGEEHLLDMLEIMPKLDTIDNIYNIQTKYTPAPSPPQQIDKSQLEPKLAQIVQVITSEPISLDAIAQKTNLDTGTLLAGLYQLELMGLVSQLPGMLYVIA